MKWPAPGPRSLAHVLLWGFLTLGVGFAWYLFVAFREVDGAVGRRHSGLLILGLVPVAGIPFTVAYTVVEVRKLAAARRAAGLPETAGPAFHVVLQLVALLPATALGVYLAGTEGFHWLDVVWVLLVVWSPAAVAAAVNGDVNGFWRAKGVRARVRPAASAKPA